jgi:hypothetical protein
MYFLDTDPTVIAGTPTQNFVNKDDFYTEDLRICTNITQDNSNVVLITTIKADGETQLGSGVLVHGEYGMLVFTAAHW